MHQSDYSEDDILLSISRSIILLISSASIIVKLSCSPSTVIYRLRGNRFKLFILVIKLE